MFGSEHYHSLIHKNKNENKFYRLIALLSLQTTVIDLEENEASRQHTKTTKREKNY